MNKHKLNKYEIMLGEQLDIALVAILESIDKLKHAPVRTETIIRLESYLNEQMVMIHNRREIERPVNSMADEKL